MCAIYEPATLAGFREYVRAARGNSPRDWLMGRDIKVLTGPQAADLRSTNTPEDFETMLAASTEAGGDTADNNEQENSDETQ